MGAVMVGSTAGGARSASVAEPATAGPLSTRAEIAVLLRRLDSDAAETSAEGGADSMRVRHSRRIQNTAKGGFWINSG